MPRPAGRRPRRLFALLAAIGLSVGVLAGPALAGPAIDVSVSSDGTSSRTTQAFSTSTTGELLVAFVGADGPAGSQTVAVSGAGLSWTLVKRANAQFGTAEIWKATATTRLSNVTVTSRPAFFGYAQSLTVVAFTGASGIGASTTRSASSGAPSATLTTTQPNSWVFGVGSDWDRTISRTLGSNQTMVHQYLVAGGATEWVQRTTAVTPSAGTNVTISDTSPTTDRFNLSICEVLGAATADVTPPTITTFSPASGATGVAASSKVTATFSEAMNAATITASSFVLQSGATSVAATVSYSSTTRIATLTPSSALASQTTYTATVNGGSSGVKDVAGNALAADMQWSFTTADTTRPTITAITPASGATGVPATTTVTAAFSEAMSASTITTSSFVLQAGSVSVPATVAYDATTHVATLTPTSSLGSVTYTATVKGGSSGVKDTAGNALAASVQWSFTVADTTAPTVTAVTPPSGATDVAVNAVVTATFSEAMSAATISQASFVLQAGGTPVPAAVAYNGTTHVATLTPSGSLAVATTYTATVSGGAAGVTDAAGNALVNDFVWSFTTLVPDTTPPAVTSTTPSSGTGVPVPSAVTATFSEPVDATTITAANFFIQTADTVLPAAVAYDASTATATLTPDAHLAMTTAYTVTIKGGTGGVADVSGNTLLDDYVWSFTTAADTDPPVLTAKTPAAGATGIPGTAVVTASFSEPLDPQTVNTTTVQLQTSVGASVTATVAYDSLTSIVTLVPSTALANSTAYTATIQGGSGGVADLAGNPISSTVTWSFTTGGQLTAGAQISVNTSSVRQTLEGLGGDYAYGQSDSAIGQFTLETLRPAHARVQMYLPEWEPVNDNSNSQIFNWAAFQDVGYTHVNFLQMQEFQRRGIGMTISVWEAPDWMVQNPGDATQRVIPSSMYGEAIESMAAYLLYARDQYGVVVQYMSINEADGGYTLQFSSSALNTFIKAASARFAALGLTTKWLAGDTANPSGVVSYASPLLQDATTRQYLGPISVHTWNSTSLADSTFTSIYNLAQQYNRPVWIEELGLDPTGLQNANYTTTWTYALSLANLYQRMMTLLHPTVVDYWEYGDDYELANPTTLAPYPAFYAIKALTDYMVPGTDVVDVSSSTSNIVVLAGKNDARQSAIVYAINNGTTAQTVKFTGLPAYVMTLLRTSSRENLATIGSYNPVSGSLTLTLPAQSINALVAGDPASAFPEVTQ